MEKPVNEILLIKRDQDQLLKIVEFLASELRFPCEYWEIISERLTEALVSKVIWGRKSLRN